MPGTGRSPTISDIDTQAFPSQNNPRPSVGGGLRSLRLRAASLVLACDCLLAFDGGGQRVGSALALRVQCAPTARLGHLAARHPLAWGCSFTLSPDSGALMQVSDPRGRPTWSVALDPSQYRAIADLIDDCPWRIRRAGGETLLRRLVEQVTGRPPDPHR